MKKADAVTFPDGTIQKTAAFYQAPSIPAGSKTNFFQATAPTGWTQCTSYNNYAMRIVSGSGGGTGGSVAFTTAFSSQIPEGSVSVSGGSISSTTLSTSQIPSHNHTFSTYDYCNNNSNPGQSNGNNPRSTSTANSGGGGSHTHSYTNPTASFSGTEINLSVKYIDNIIAIKE